MSDKPISDLRRRLLQDMTNRNFGAKTQCVTTIRMAA
jgi:hypothetical protein